MKIFLKKQSRGFTIIETLVAIFILTIVLSVSMGIIQQTLIGSNLARDEIIAYNLAEEGIEYIRSIRDSNSLNGSNWLVLNSSTNPPSYLTDSNVCGGGGCGVDAVNGDLSGDLNRGVEACSGTSCQLHLESVPPYFYSYNVSDPLSRFTRVITVKPVNNLILKDTVYEVVVTSTVSWPGGSYSLSERLYDWQ